MPRPSSPLVDALKAALKRVPGRAERLPLQRALGEALVRRGRLPEARALARRLPPAERTGLLASLAEALATQGKAKAAHALLASLPDALPARVAVTVALARAGRPRLAREALDATLAAAGTLAVGQLPTLAPLLSLTDVAPDARALQAAGVTRRLEVLRRELAALLAAGAEDGRFGALLALAPHVEAPAALALLAEARALAPQAPSEREADRAHADVALGYGQLGRLELAREALKACRHAWSRAEGLSRLALQQLEAGRTVPARALVAEADKLLCEPNTLPWREDEPLVAFAGAAARAGRLSEAQGAALRPAQGELRALALARVARHAPRAREAQRLLQLALTEALALQVPSSRARALFHVDAEWGARGEAELPEGARLSLGRLLVPAPVRLARRRGR